MLCGIRTVGYFIIGRFTETEETMDETIEFARKLELDDFRVSFFTPLPGTPASKEVDSYGELDNTWSNMTLFQPVFIPEGLTRKLLLRYQKRAIRKFFFRPRAIYSYLKMVKNPRVAIKGALYLAQYLCGQQ